MHDAPLLCRFRSVRPRHETPQETTLAWLVAAHARAERTAGGRDLEEGRFVERMRKVIDRCACGPSKIARRGHVIDDFLHTRWGEMKVYDLSRDARGAPAGVRTAVYEEEAAELVRRAFEEVDRPPSDLVHVTCTGYASPSCAQRLVAARGWGAATRVTHAYHMGCYAAVPALRVACGFVAGGSAEVDVVHTELCSLHLDPLDHSPEQIVIQSLFADGCIRYAVCEGGEPGLRVRAMREEIVPGSGGSMRWTSSEHGMHMALARDVPERIAGRLRPFLAALFADAGLDLGEHRHAAIFAVHPGGPRIVDGVRDVLELTEPQVAASRDVLLRYGNMSSATLPHVWMQLTADPSVAPGSVVASLAFGPGLTICGALLIKE